MEHFIQQYGYLAIFIGTFLEGETILVLAGFAAHRGYLGLAGVIMAAFLGSLLGDQLFFQLGRHHSATLLKLRPTWQPRLERSRDLIHNHQNLIILGFRFLYGLRTVTPFALGISKVAWQRFALLNGLGALVWAAAFGSAGYIFGQTLELWLGDLRKYEYLLFAIIAGIGALAWGLHRTRQKSSRKDS
ncbi:MAG: DedA family protein [Desulfuromonas sp.]|nr:MAG: DedA family protein [Desulfuromonas sp.]